MVAADGQGLEAALATLPAPAAAGQQATAVSRAGLADAHGWPLARLPRPSPTSTTHWPTAVSGSTWTSSGTATRCTA
jgi:hypothetical protein